MFELLWGQGLLGSKMLETTTYCNFRQVWHLQKAPRYECQFYDTHIITAFMAVGRQKDCEEEGKEKHLGGKWDFPKYKKLWLV